MKGFRILNDDENGIGNKAAIFHVIERVNLNTPVKKEIKGYNELMANEKRELSVWAYQFRTRALDFEVYVDTDSEEIIKEIDRDKNLSHVFVYKRDNTLLGHKTSVCDLIKHFVINHCKSNNEIICQIHVTSPFLNAKTLTNALSLLEKGHDSIVSCRHLQSRLWRKEK